MQSGSLAASAPRFGEPGAAVLAGLGYSDEKVAELTAAEVVLEGRRQVSG